jgi:hypothetical protein
MIVIPLTISSIVGLVLVVAGTILLIGAVVRAVMNLRDKDDRWRGVTVATLLGLLIEFLGLVLIDVWDVDS